MSEDEEVRQRPPPAILKFPAGIDNRSREYALAEGAARSIENMDVTRDGGLISRKGMRLVLADDAHSLFVPPHQRFMLAVFMDNLVRISPDEEYETLVSDVGQTVYAVLNDEVFWTDGTKTGRVLADGSPSLWGLNAPPSPQVTVLAEGGLRAGTYQIALTAIHPTGLESPASEIFEVVVGENSGVAVTVPSSGAGIRFGVYSTTGDGEAQHEMRLYGTAPGGGVVRIDGAFAGRKLETLRAVKPLPGQCLATCVGRLWVASGTTIFFTDERSPHWMFPERGFFQFGNPVTLLSPTDDGLYVGTKEEIVFLHGTDPYQMQQRKVSSAGAPRQSSFTLPHFWFPSSDMPGRMQSAFVDSEGFLCVGQASGDLFRPTVSRFAAGNAQQAFGVAQVHEGLSQVVVAADVDGYAPYIARDTAVADVFLQGVVLNGS